MQLVVPRHREVAAGLPAAHQAASLQVEGSRRTEALTWPTRRLAARLCTSPRQSPSAAVAAAAVPFSRGVSGASSQLSQASLPFCRAHAGSWEPRGRQRASGALPTGLVALPRTAWRGRNDVETLLAILYGAVSASRLVESFAPVLRRTAHRTSEVIKTITRTRSRPQQRLVTGACCGVRGGRRQSAPSADACAVAL